MRIDIPYVLLLVNWNNERSVIIIEVSMYSQTSREQTPLGPSMAVRLREVSTYRRLKNTDIIGVGYDSHTIYLIAECECVCVKCLSTHKNVTTLKFVLRRLI